MFYKYRMASPWSSPEVLKNKRKMPDPTAAMDVYSFGILMWEMWHEKLPFGGDLDEAIKVVLADG